MPSPKRYAIEQVVPLARERVWELLANTDHLNRLIGLFAVKAGPAREDDGGFSRELESRVMGLVTLRWKEFPFEWSKNREYSVVRRYLGGPMREFRGGVRLTDHGDGGTLVHLFAEFTPRNVIGAAAIPLVGRRSMRLTMKYLTAFLALNRARFDFALPQPKVGYRVNREELDRLLVRLADAPVGGELTARFREHIVHAGDDEVVDMKPYALADRWGMDRREALRWFLYATLAGITNLSWRLICPNCRVSKLEARTLSDVAERFHCDFCGIEYGANFDRSIELTFSIRDELRAAVKSVYCVGGPQLTPHIQVQCVVERRTSREVEAPAHLAAFRLRVLRLNHSVMIRRSESSGPAQKLLYTNDGWIVDSMEIAPGAAAVAVRNDSDRDIVVACERSDWGDDSVTAATVTTMEEFRRMFSSEVLAPGHQISVESVTLMFTDLLGSTSFYESVGDARAYGQVRRHFGFLTEWIARHGGSVVKTIGDAVMAVFQSPAAGLEAALDIQTHVGEFSAVTAGADPVVIKIGLNHGPAIAVNSNDRLDYFGRTVNIAARVQGLSEGGDIVVPEELCAVDRAAALLSGHKLERFDAALKGIEGSMRLVRITPREVL